MQINAINTVIDNKFNYKQSFTSNRIKELSGDFFQKTTDKIKDKNPKNLIERFKELKQFNIPTVSLIKIASLNEDEYKIVLNALNENQERKQALSEGKTKVKFERQKEKFSPITEITLMMEFSDGYGFWSETLSKSDDKTSVNKKTLLKSYKSRQEMSMEDNSKLNPEYTVRNMYGEARNYKNLFKIYQKRNIKIKNNAGKTILAYDFGQFNKQKSNVSTFDINNQIYRVEVKDKPKAIVVTNKKAVVMDFSNRIDESVLKKKNNFIKALKKLPPQILYALNENFDTITSVRGEGEYNNRTLGINLYSSKVAVKSITNTIIEFLSYKRHLIDDKNLIEKYQKEVENFKNWAISDKASDNTILKPESFIKNTNNDTEALLEIIKEVCDLIWYDEYDDNKPTDEEKRILLNFFPETVSHIITAFELNNI